MTSNPRHLLWDVLLASRVSSWPAKWSQGGAIAGEVAAAGDPFRRDSLNHP